MRHRTTALAALAAVFVLGNAHAQDPAYRMLEMARSAVTEERWSDAEELFAAARETADVAARDTLAFLQAHAAYRQGQVIARDNTAASAAVAITHIERARSILTETTYPRRSELQRAAAAFIAHQQAVIGANLQR